MSWPASKNVFLSRQIIRSLATYMQRTPASGAVDPNSNPEDTPLYRYLSIRGMHI